MPRLPFHRIILIPALFFLCLSSSALATSGLLCELVAAAPAIELLKKYKTEAVQMLETEAERAPYELTLRDGHVFSADGLPFDTTLGSAVDEQGEEHRTGRAIFVISRTGKLYASKRHKVGVFHHSSFVNGEPVLAAGELGVSKGVIRLVSHRSGHYHPGSRSLKLFLDLLNRHGFAPSDVKIMLSGLEKSIWAEEFEVGLDVFTEGYDASANADDANESILLTALRRSRSPPMNIVLYLLFHRPGDFVQAPPSYPVSYAPIVFEALKTLVHDPATRPRMLFELQTASRSTYDMRNSRDFDQALRELKRELPKSPELEQLLEARQAAGVIAP